MFKFIFFMGFVIFSISVFDRPGDDLKNSFMRQHIKLTTRGVKKSKEQKPFRLEIKVKFSVYFNAE